MPVNLSALFGSHIDNPSSSTSFVGKIVLWTALLAGLLLMFWLAQTFSIPADPGFSASLLQQNGWPLSVVVVVVGMIAVMFVSAVISSPLRSEAPVFCTAIACGVISWRGGTMQTTLFAASGPGVFISLALETVILFAALVGAWLLLRRVRSRPAVSIVAELDAKDDGDEGLDEKLLALFTQASAMMALMILLCRSDAKNQSLAAVGVSSALAAAIAVHLLKVRSSFWLWIGPVAVAVFGYIFAAFHAQGWQAGLLHGPLAALARPLPLDYVSMGPAGAIFGYWMSGGGGEPEDVLSDAEPS